MPDEYLTVADEILKDLYPTLFPGKSQHRVEWAKQPQEEIVGLLTEARHKIAIHIRKFAEKKEEASSLSPLPLETETPPGSQR